MSSDIIVVALNIASPRTHWVSEALKAPLYVIKSRPPYTTLIPKLAHVINMRSPRIVLVELPSGPLLLATISLKKIRNFTLIADVHTGFLTARPGLSKHSLLNYPFKPLLRYTDCILIHNKLNMHLIDVKLHKKTRVLLDPFYILREKYRDNTPSNRATMLVEKIRKRYSDYLVYPASWHPDEPIDWIIGAWEKYYVRPVLVVTGRPRIKKRLSNVVLTGYLPDNDFVYLLKNSTAILSASTSPLDMQHSAFEALALRKPIIASLTPVLYSVLSNSAIYFRNFDDKSLLDAVNKLVTNINHYRASIAKHADRLEKEVRNQVSRLKTCRV